MAPAEELGQIPRAPALVVQDNRNQTSVTLYQIQAAALKALEAEQPAEVIAELRRLMPPPAEGAT